ncbi:MAG: ChaN family lipoprotein [Paracoccaceae bacterium]|nr:ChaN family lipoprotein [Paracoccaceae bacterium]
MSLVAGAALAAPAFSSELTDLAEFDPGEAQVVILGEVHDNPAHHEAQAKLVARTTPAAVVFEMLTPEQARTVIDMGAASGIEALAEALGWARSGWPDFAMYHPILAAAGDAAIYGAALPRDRVRAAVTDGAVEIFGEGYERFGLGDPLPEAEQATREAGQMSAHCDALPEGILPGMVAAQRLRDAHFARVTLDALGETGGPVAVITGNGHARTDWGIPAAIARAAPQVDVLSLGQVEAPPEPPIPFDIWRVTAAPEREDPCTAFR